MVTVFWWVFWAIFLFNIFLQMFDEDRAVEAIAVSSILRALMWGAAIAWSYALICIVVTSGI